MIQTSRIHYGHGHRGHGLRLGTTPSAVDVAMEELSVAGYAADNAIGEASAAGRIGVEAANALSLRVTDLTNEASAAASSSDPLEVRVQKIREIAAAIRRIGEDLRATILADEAAQRLRTFWWSVGAVTLGLGAGFAWLAISKRKAK